MLGLIDVHIWVFSKYVVIYIYVISTNLSKAKVEQIFKKGGIFGLRVGRLIILILKILMKIAKVNRQKF